MQVMGTARRRSHGLLVAAVVLWLGTVAALGAVRAATGWDAPGALAASPDALAGGRLWLLPASGLIVQGAVPALQLAAAALLAWGVVRRLGPATFWIAAVAGHVGATLLTYGAIGALWLVDAPAARPVTDAPDYGISAVSAACAGALAASGTVRHLPRPRLAVALGVGALAAFAVLTPARGELTAAEHLIAFAAGAAVVVLGQHHGGRAHRHALRPARLPSLRRRPRPAPGPVR